MSLYTQAVSAISSFRAIRQAELDQAALIARQNNLMAVKLAIRNLIAEDDPFRCVAEFIAEDVSIGRESDGYPERRLSNTAQTLLLAAIKARPECGLSSIYPFGGIRLNHLAENDGSNDYEAWRSAGNYRKDRVEL